MFSRNRLQYAISQSFCLLILLPLLSGCRNSNNEDQPEPTSADQSPKSAAMQMATGEDPDVGSDTFSPTRIDPNEPDLDLGRPDGRAVGVKPPMAAIPDPILATQDAVPAATYQLAGSEDEEAGESDAERETQREYRLPANMSPKALIAFLSDADADMKTLYSNPNMAKSKADYESKLNLIATLKLEASRELKNHASSTEEQKVAGVRGEMQALSHLAAMKDAKAGDSLIQLAKEHLDSEDAELVADSRIVLIGFALESMQSGLDKTAPDQIATLVDQFKKEDKSASVPALMVMAQARHLLSQYGYDEQAASVREKILELFADSSDPTVAQLAAQAAGNLAYDEIDRQLKLIVKGESVLPEQWIQMANKLIDQAPDLVTVKYLAGAALEFEALGKLDLVRATFEVLQNRFTEKGGATTREVELAAKLRRAREAIIGSEFALNLKTLAGASMPITDFKGKIVLMPFWAVELPASLQVFPLLNKAAEDHPDDVVIVGLNFDSASAPVEEFILRSGYEFQSYRAPNQTDDPENSILAHFGLASLPFVVVLDQEAQVAAIDFRGTNLESTIQRLLQTESP